MQSKFKQLNLFGPKSEDFGSKTEGQKESNPEKDSRTRDPTKDTKLCQEKKIDLTEVQKERARALRRKSKALASNSEYFIKNPPQVKSKKS